MTVRLPIGVRRFAYRVAYVLLATGSRLVRPRTRGVKCLVTSGDRVLLVRHSYGPRQWDIPGGFCRRHEPFAAAVRRELAEELGIEDARWTDLGEHRRNHQGRVETLGFFRAEVDGIEEPAVDRAELIEVRWFPRGTLPVPHARIVDELVERLRIHPAGAQPG